MENKIEVGEYIRTKDGRIDKVDRYSIGCCVYHCKNGMCIDECETVGIPISDIKKHSSNIIDLIEVGDYVNGYKILDIADSIYKNSKRILIYRNEKEKYERWIYIQEYDGKIHTQDDIKSIVTKEQFKIIEYEI